MDLIKILTVSALAFAASACATPLNDDVENVDREDVEVDLCLDGPCSPGSELTSDDAFHFVRYDGEQNHLIIKSPMVSNIDFADGLQLVGVTKTNDVWHKIGDCFTNEGQYTVNRCEIPRGHMLIRAVVAAVDTDNCDPHPTEGTCAWDAMPEYYDRRTRPWMALGLDTMANPDATLPSVNLCFEQFEDGRLQPRTDNCNLETE